MTFASQVLRKTWHRHSALELVKNTGQEKTSPSMLTHLTYPEKSGSGACETFTTTLTEKNRMENRTGSTFDLTESNPKLVHTVISSNCSFLRTLFLGMEGAEERNY